MTQVDSGGGPAPQPDQAVRRWGSTRPMRPDNPEWDATRAAVLVDALPWLTEFYGQVVVIKYGGNAMTDDRLKRAFAQDMVFLRHVGIRPVVVHGGGPQVTAMLNRLGVDSQFRAGLRVTTEETVDVVRMVLVGQVGRELVGLINEHGPHAVGPVRRGRRRCSAPSGPSRW